MAGVSHLKILDKSALGKGKYKISMGETDWMCFNSRKKGHRGWSIIKGRVAGTFGENSRSQIVQRICLTKRFRFNSNSLGSIRKLFRQEEHHKACKSFKKIILLAVREWIRENESKENQLWGVSGKMVAWTPVVAVRWRWGGDILDKFLKIDFISGEEKVLTHNGSICCDWGCVDWRRFKDGKSLQIKGSILVLLQLKCLLYF